MEEEVAASEEVLTDLLDKLSDMVRQPMASETQDRQRGGTGWRLWDTKQVGPGRVMHQILLKEYLPPLFFNSFRAGSRRDGLPTNTALK